MCLFVAVTQSTQGSGEIHFVMDKTRNNLSVICNRNWCWWGGELDKQRARAPLGFVFPVPRSLTPDSINNRTVFIFDFNVQKSLLVKDNAK